MIPPRDAQPGKETAKPRLPLSWALKVGGSTLILGITLWVLPTGEVWGALTSLPFELWLLVFALFLIGHVAGAAKWWLVLGGNIPLVTALRAHFAGLAANLCLPGAAGGDVVRMGLAFKDSRDKAALAVGCLADRLADTLGLVLLSAAGLVLLGGAGDALNLVLGAAALLIIAGMIAVFFVLPVIVERIPAFPLRKVAVKLSIALMALRRRPVTLVLALAASTAIQGSFVALTVLLAAASGVEAPIAAWYFAWPLAKLIAMVPVSVAGIGVREASLAALMAPMGAAPAGVVAASLIWQSVLFAAGLVGGLAWLFSSSRRASLAVRGAPSAPRPLEATDS